MEQLSQKCFSKQLQSCLKHGKKVPAKKKICKEIDNMKSQMDILEPEKSTNQSK